MHLKTQYRILVWLFFFFCVSSLTAQIEFEPGYYLNSAGEKVVGQIGNELWRLAPESFSFIDKNGQKSTIPIGEATLFEIDGKEKFVRATVQVDISSSVVELMTESMAPVFEAKTTFLLVRLDGEASLYEYLWKGSSRFFLSTDGGGNIIPLVYKQYRVNENQIGENVQFRQSLLANLADKGIVVSDVQSLSYNLRALTKLLEKVNGVERSKPPLGSLIRERTEIGVRAGIYTWTLDIFPAPYTNTFKPGIGGQVGFDLALLLPLNKFTLGLSFSPTFRYASQNSEFQFNDVALRYYSLDIPIGLRAYFSPNKSLRFFVGGGPDIIFNLERSKIYYSRWIDLRLHSGFGDINYYAEVGCTLNRKYSIQVTYRKRDLFLSKVGTFDITSLVFGVNL